MVEMSFAESDDTLSRQVH